MSEITTRTLAKEIRRRNPEMPLTEIARICGVSKQAVHATLHHDEDVNCSTGWTQRPPRHEHIKDVLAFSIGDRVVHKGRMKHRRLGDDYGRGTVIAIHSQDNGDSAVEIQFDYVSRNGKHAGGLYDSNWFAWNEGVLVHENQA